MDPMLDLVRQRTDDLRRVADDVRRERDLRAMATVPSSVRVGASSHRPAQLAVDGEHRCTPAGQGA
jgi:hypothetical protein